MFHIILAELFRKQLSLILLSSKRHSFSAQENANHSDCFSVSNHSLGILSILSITHAPVVWYWKAESDWKGWYYQSLTIQYHPNQSTIDDAGETLSKKQKVKYAASMHTFHGAASGRYIQEKNQSRVKNRTWGIKCKWEESERAHLEIEKRYQADIHWNISWFELKSRVTSDLDSPGLSGGLRPVLKK